MVTRAALYLRMSLDATGQGLGVDRQRQACTALAESRGWEIVETYIDNSVSASKTRGTGTAYARLRNDYAAGNFDALICWDLDRLTRQPRELEDWIDAAEDHGLRLVTANGEADLSTDGGRLFARIKAAVARGEVERKSARQKAAHEQRRDQGRPWGTRRPYGYTDPRLTALHPTEAPIVVDLYDRLLAGESQLGLVRWLNNNDHHTTLGNPWRQSGLRDLLVNPRNAALIGKRDPDTRRWTILGNGAWDPIISEDTWRETVARLTPTVARKGGGRRTRLLSGLAQCAICETPLRAGQSATGRPQYLCPQFHLGRATDLLDDYVTTVIIARLNQPDALPALTRTTPTIGQDLADLDTRQRHNAEQWALGLITDAQYETANRVLRDRIQTLTASLDTTRLPVTVTPGTARDTWATASLDTRRALIRLLADIVVHPAGKGRRDLDPATVEIRWHQ